jgi:hypothetical protein
MTTEQKHRYRHGFSRLFVCALGVAGTLVPVWGAGPKPPLDPSDTPVPVVAGAVAAQAVLDKALASGQALVADLTRSDNKSTPARCRLVKAKSAEPLTPGRYRLHALVATTPQDNIVSEAVTLFVWIRGRYRGFEPKEFFAEPGKLAPVHFDFTLDKPEPFDVCFDWLVGESVSSGYPGGKAEQVGAYNKARNNFILQLGLKGGPDMSMNKPSVDDVDLGQALDDMGKEKRLQPRPVNDANLPANRILLTGLVIERMSPVEVVTVRTDPVACEPGATGRATAEVRNLDTKPVTTKLVWTVTEAKRPDAILARHEETVTLAAGEQRTVAMAAPLATAGITRLGRVRVETVVEGLRPDACRTSFVVLPPKRTAPAERPKKVFAHYMGCYPAGTGITSLHLFEDSTSILHESKDPVAQIGGRFRNFPLVWQEPGLKCGKAGWGPLTAEESADLEIRRAMRIGIDGFAVDAWAGGNNAMQTFETLIKVAAEKNYPFEMTLCLDNAAPVTTVKWLLKNFGKNPKLARRDGKPLVFDYNSSFKAYETLAAEIDERIPQSERQAAMNRLKATELGWHLIGQTYRKWEEQIGEPVFFSFDLCWFFFQMPDVKPDMPVRAAAAISRHVPLLWSFSTYGVNGNLDEISKAVRDAGAEWGGATAYHQKEGYSGSGFEVYMPKGTEWMGWNWNALRSQEATCLQLVTWNDYTENTNIGPAYNTRYTIYDLTGYQIEWWRTGKKPVPDHDRVYVIYPKYPQDAKIWPFKGKGGPRGIEVKTILTAPATIRLPGRNIEYQAGAGMDWIGDDYTNKDWDKDSKAMLAKDKFCRAQGYRQFPVTPGPVIVEVVRDGKVVLRLESPEPITDRPFRQDCGAVCWSTEEERHWKADFGDRPMFVYSEYGDADKDGLPNWFEMYWFSKERGFKPAVIKDPVKLLDGSKEHPITRWPDVSTQTLVDPNADPDDDGKSNLQEYLDRTDPTLQEIRGAVSPGL